jgi:hypothetical protein
MKLPHQSQPTPRNPADFGAARSATAGGVTPARVQPPNDWTFKKPGKGSGQCVCVLDNKLGVWRPSQNNCGYLGYPQCDRTGGCRCVRKDDQSTGGAARDPSAVQGLYQALNFT